MKTLLLCAFLSAALGGAPPSDECDKRRRPVAPEPANGPVLKGLRIHEWGVFLAGKKGTRASAGGEPPTFIQRVEMQVPDPEPACDLADKPVLHVYPPGPLDLEVHVSFPGGKPKLAWPRGNPGWSGCPKRSPGLSWSLKVLGDTKRKDAPPLEVPEGHWIAACRKVGASRLVSGRDYDSFLFYEGQVPALLPAKAARLPAGYHAEAWSISAPPSVSEAWVVLAGADGKLRRSRGKGLDRPCDLERGFVAEALKPEALRTELSGALQEAGLSAPEADCVLDIWMPELVKPGRRLVYLLPREAYDRLLPITFDPMPEELKRVGLVVQEVEP